MMIYVSGVSTVNKGAELMLLAVQDHYREVAPAVQLAVDPWFGSYADRARYGLRTKLVPTKFGRSSLAMKLMPPSFRNSYGLVTDDDLHGLIDASGFAFSDDFGPLATQKMAAVLSQFKRTGKPVAMLPQALGPFTGECKAAFAEVLRHVDLLFARDQRSFDHVVAAFGKTEKLRMSGDFTNLVKPRASATFTPPADMACVILNHRMIEKTDAAMRAAYLPFMAAAIREAEAMGLTPVIVQHDTAVDATLLPPLFSELRHEVAVVDESDPRVLKWILGRARLVIGSRFHALVGSLSQGVPTIATGWSHKYPELFRDYGCVECVIAPTAPAEDLARLLHGLIRGDSARQTQQKIAAHAEQLKQQSQDMWRQVDTVIRPPAPVKKTVVHAH